jgi:3-deoxy-D-manno-octulosonate 8-phosphate phosphatase (KDO 8-P phosphatase)
MLPVKSKRRQPATIQKAVQAKGSTLPARTPVVENVGLPARLKRIKLFLCDVDGVLTDGGVYMGADTEYKRFNILDGLGLRLLQRQGIKVGWISNRPSFATTQRAADLKVDYLWQKDSSKVAAAEEIISQARCDWSDICYMGDDVVDLGLLRRAGLAVTVPHAIRDVQLISHYTTQAPAGHGAVREVVQLILQAQDKWLDLVEHFSR